MWSLRKRFTFSERNEFKLRHKNSTSRDCMLGNCPDYLKPGLSLSDFKSVVDLISFLQCQRAEKKIVKVNQAMSFGQVIPKWVETISNLKRHIYIYIYIDNMSKLPVRIIKKISWRRAKAPIHVDYSKSYNNTQQVEIQSVYFDQQNFSIFTSCSYYL